MHAPTWSDTFSISCSIYCKIFKVCLTILGNYALKDYKKPHPLWLWRQKFALMIALAILWNKGEISITWKIWKVLYILLPESKITNYSIYLLQYQLTFVVTNLRIMYHKGNFHIVRAGIADYIVKTLLPAMSHQALGAQAVGALHVIAQIHSNNSSAKAVRLTIKGLKIDEVTPTAPRFSKISFKSAKHILRPKQKKCCPQSLTNG